MKKLCIFIIRLCLDDCLSNLIQVQGKMYDNKRKMKGRKGSEEAEIDSTNEFLLGNQVIASCKELNDYMKLAAVKQKLLVNLIELDH